MKTAKIYIAAALSLLIGLVVFFVGFAMIDFDIAKLSTEPEYEQKSFVSSEKITNIVLNDSNIGVELNQSKDDKVHITYYENGKDYYEIETSADGTLTFNKKINRKWYDYIYVMNFTGHLKLSVEIPDGYEGNLSVKTSNGKIQLVDIDANNIDANNIIATSSNSGISLNKVTTLGTLETHTSNGQINFSDVSAANDLICKTSNSPIDLSDTQGGDIFVDSSNGSISLKDTASLENISITTSNSSVDFYSIDFAKEFSCKNSNGAIKGRLNGKMSDYSIISRISNGKSNLPESMNGGEKKIDLKTSNSNIDVDFSE